NSLPPHPLHDALPICCSLPSCVSSRVVFDRRTPSVWVPSRRTVNHHNPDATMSVADMIIPCSWLFRTWGSGGGAQPVQTERDLRSEEHTSELQSRFDL